MQGGFAGDGVAKPFTGQYSAVLVRDLIPNGPKDCLSQWAMGESDFDGTSGSRSVASTLDKDGLSGSRLGRLGRT